MANQEQIEILKQGVDIWNQWREENLDIEINLMHANLNHANLMRANLSHANLGLANLVGADLREANLLVADLSEADLFGANLGKANLFGADLSGADLHEADLVGSNLSQTVFSGVDLSSADLSRADLSGAYFDICGLSEANLREASLYATRFIETDLSGTNGLETINHRSASSLGTDTLQLSQGKIPEVFLRGCGLSDWEIETAKLYNPELSNEERNKILYKVYDLQANQAVQISPLFISYSHADGGFVDRIEKSLDEKGIRFWRDIHRATAGKLEKQIDRAISQNPTVLVILSKNSLNSDWVQHEVRKARELEKEFGRDVLCPVALDDSWKNSNWPQRVMEQIKEYNILDFSEWNDEKRFEKMFEKMFAKLIHGLNLYYKKEEKY